MGIKQSNDESDTDYWCSPVDAPNHADMKLYVDEILMALDWPDDIPPKYHTLKEEVLSHDVIGERTWSRIVSDCCKAIEVESLFVLHDFWSM